MKKVSSKLFICFRPELLDIDIDHHHHRVRPFEMDPKLEGSNSSFRVHKSSSSTPNLKVDQEASTSTSTIHPLIFPSPKKNLSRAIKSVLFEIIPVRIYANFNGNQSRRIRDRRSLKRESDRSSRGSSSSSSSEELTSPETTCASSPSSLWSPPSRSVSAPELRILADRHQVSTPRRRDLQNDNNNNYEKTKPEDNQNKFMIYMFLVATLMATVFLGKLCAILFTSICLYFLLGRGATVVGSCSRRKQPGAMRYTTPGRLEESTGKYRRNRVVMEGILDRNHHHRRQR